MSLQLKKKGHWPVFASSKKKVRGPLVSLQQKQRSTTLSFHLHSKPHIHGHGGHHYICIHYTTSMDAGHTTKSAFAPTSFSGPRESLSSLPHIAGHRTRNRKSALATRHPWSRRTPLNLQSLHHIAGHRGRR